MCLLALVGLAALSLTLGAYPINLIDSLRALLLEAYGYDTQVFEFISLEHTSKNKMILAQKRKKAGDNSQVLKQIAELKAFYGIKQHTLETLLANSAQTAEQSS